MELKEIPGHGAQGVDAVDRESANGASADATELARQGKKQVLKRRFGLVSMIGFTAGLMCTWEGVLGAFTLGLTNGGPAGLIYGFLFTWIGTLSVTGVMGELASMMPTAGGQYHWIGVLAPDSCRRFLSYVAGWITVAGWTLGTAAAAFTSSSMIQALMILNNPDYHPERWHNTLLFWAMLIIALALNTILGRALPAIEILILILHVLGFFAIIIPLAYLAPTTDPRAVFTTWNNGGGWYSTGVAFFIGLLGNVSAFVGTDGPIHMSEEVQNASLNVPRAMMASIGINGFLAFGVLLTVLFHSGSLKDAMDSKTKFPFIAIFEIGTGSRAAATVMTTVILTLQVCAATGGMASASRMAWAFARDRGLPGHKQLVKVERRTSIPIHAVLTIFTFAVLLGLINIGSSTAFNAFFSMAAESFYTSYLIVCSLLLWRRLRGDIHEPVSPSDLSPNNTSAAEITLQGEGGLTWGGWRVPGALGTANNVVAFCYLVIIAFFGYWPTHLPVNATNMNYSALVTGTVAIASLLYYFTRAKRWYTGPVVEI